MTRAFHIISKSKKRLTLFGALVVMAVSAVVAVAYFTSHGAGTGQASAGHLNPPTAVNASTTVGTGTVSVSWTASITGSGAVAPQGYYVTRIKNSDSSTAAACGT